MAICGHALLAPYLAGDLADHPQLRPLLLLGEDVALFGGGEAALRRQTELLERGEFAGFLDAALDVDLVLERSALRSDEAEHHDLVALGQPPQRLEAAGELGVVFEEIAVIIASAQQIFRDRFVTARRNPGRPEIAATDVGRD